MHEKNRRLCPWRRPALRDHQGRRGRPTPFHQPTTRVRKPFPPAGEGGPKGRMRGGAHAPAPNDCKRGPPIMSAIDGVLITRLTGPLIRRFAPPSPARGEG